MVGKKNLEVRPVAVNKGEIVKRILYMNPDAEFIFCAGDDKASAVIPRRTAFVTDLVLISQTDEDMFRALHLFQPGQTSSRFDAPLSVTLIDNKDAPPVDLKIKQEAVFTTAVGHRSKRTLASWHVTTPQEIVEHMLDLVKLPQASGDDDSAKL